LRDVREHYRLDEQVRVVASVLCHVCIGALYLGSVILSEAKDLRQMDPTPMNSHGFHPSPRWKPCSCN